MNQPKSSLAEIWDRQSWGYDAWYGTPAVQRENRSIKRQYLRVYSRLMRNYWTSLKWPPFTIDIGCGTGLLLDLVWAGTSSYAGIDISPNMVKEALRKHPGLNIEVGDANEYKKWSYSSEGSNLVVALFSLNYLGGDLAGFSTKVHELTHERGGYLIIALRAERRWQRRYKNSAAPQVFWSRHELQRAFPGARVTPWRFGDKYLGPVLDWVLCRLFPGNAAYYVITR